MAISDFVIHIIVKSQFFQGGTVPSAEVAYALGHSRGHLDTAFQVPSVFTVGKLASFMTA